VLGASIVGADGSTSKFAPGERARISVTLEAIGRAERTAVVIQLLNTDFYDVFNTSSERLGSPPVSLSPGEQAVCEFDLDLHLGPGTYYLGVYLYRYDRELEYDHLFPASSFVMTSMRDTRGAANLYPAVTRFELVPVSAAFSGSPRSIP